MISINTIKVSVRSQRSKSFGRLTRTFSADLTRTKVLQACQILGLPAAKSNQAQGDLNITQGDLAATENRVAKLGVLLGAVSTAAASLTRENVAITTQNILAKLVAMEGPLRKTTNHQKTIDMIICLAEIADVRGGLGQDKVDKFCRTAYPRTV